ncbi:hypothetical protein Dsin_001012 [Dipteronia sinensis]|uniref:Uncharacterized protein n=1 Tax=Dipteronia sinensis TaxID=43782 RepID=A0AAE0EI15_9ROSI|nr:hypothetical protein Dsin_001012 [Dipteronia sinensis]
MEANTKYEDARELSYADFPTKWVWHSQSKTWKKRKFGKCIGRIFYVHPSSGERFYLQMLLNIMKGAQSFEDIRTVNGVTYETYKATCYVFGLLDEDKEWHETIVQAAQWSTGS